MNFKESKAIYLQIADRICDEILLGQYPEEERIPSVREYAAIVEVNANTVMRSFDYLQVQNIIYNKRGIGYFVALTFKIESVSDYVKHPKDTVLIMNLNLTNDFSGTYQMVAIRYTLTANDEELTPSSVNMQRTLKAVSKDQARFFNVTQSSDLSATGNVTTEDYFNSIDNNGVTFTRQPDGTFTVAGWKNLPVSNGTVSFEDGTFTFCYDYESGGKRYRLRGTMTK